MSLFVAADHVKYRASDHKGFFFNTGGTPVVFNANLVLQPKHNIILGRWRLHQHSETGDLHFSWLKDDGQYESGYVVRVPGGELIPADPGP